MMHLVCPPKFYIAFVSNFSKVLHVVQREIEDNLLMQNFGGKQGGLWEMCKWRIG